MPGPGAGDHHPAARGDLGRRSRARSTYVGVVGRRARGAEDAHLARCRGTARRRGTRGPTRAASALTSFISPRFAVRAMRNDRLDGCPRAGLRSGRRRRRRRGRGSSRRSRGRRSRCGGGMRCRVGLVRTETRLERLDAGRELLGLLLAFLSGRVLFHSLSSGRRGNSSHGGKNVEPTSARNGAAN